MTIMNEMVKQAVEEEYQQHRFVYHIDDSKKPTPTEEGLAQVKLGNITIYLPEGAVLGVLRHSQFLPISVERSKTLTSLQEMVESKINRQEQAEKERLEMRRIADEHRAKAQKEQDELRKKSMASKEKAPETEAPGAPPSKA